MLMKLTLIIPCYFSWPVNAHSVIYTPENHTLVRTAA